MGANDTYLNYDQAPALSQNNLLPGQKTLDPDTLQRLTDQTNHAINNQQQDRQFVDRDVANTQKLLPGAGQINASPINSGMPPGLGEALASRAQRSYDTSIQSAKTLSDIESPYQQSARLGQVGQQQNAYQSLQLKNYKEQMQYVLQQRQAYNDWVKAKNEANSSFLGGLLGGLGTLTGAVLGGPLGAMAGGSIGSSVGKSV